MADIWNQWGSDYQISASGDLVLTSGSDEGRLRILRRLLTNPGDYMWHPDYGAGLPSKIGETTKAADVENIVRRQMLMEAAVSPDPPPKVNVTPITGGFLIQITYRDRMTGDPRSLGFNIEW